jgi:hypothetical protein
MRMHVGQSSRRHGVEPIREKPPNKLKMGVSPEEALFWKRSRRNVMG